MFLKRIFDFLASLFDLLILWPVMLVIALLIKSKCPVARCSSPRNG